MYSHICINYGRVTIVGKARKGWVKVPANNNVPFVSAKVREGWRELALARANVALAQVQLIGFV